MRASGQLILFNDQYLEKETKQGNSSQEAKPGSYLNWHQHGTTEKQKTGEHVTDSTRFKQSSQKDGQFLSIISTLRVDKQHRLH